MVVKIFFIYLYKQTNKTIIQMKAVIFKDGTITYQKGQSIFTEKIVSENEEYYTVVEIGAGEELWNAGYAVGNRVYKNPIDLTNI